MVNALQRYLERRAHYAAHIATPADDVARSQDRRQLNVVLPQLDSRRPRRYSPSCSSVPVVPISHQSGMNADFVIARSFN